MEKNKKVFIAILSGLAGATTTILIKEYNISTGVLLIGVLIISIIVMVLIPFIKDKFK